MQFEQSGLCTKEVLCYCAIDPITAALLLSSTDHVNLPTWIKFLSQYIQVHRTLYIYYI